MKKDAGSRSHPMDYRLHTQAVEDLVGATEENTPHYSREELEKYRSGRRGLRLPQAVKAVLIKAWFYGAVCFFVFWGMGLYIADRLDLYFVAAVILGMVTDLLINHFLRFTEKMPGGSAGWMMVTARGARGFFLNVLYGFAILFGVMTAYSAVNALLAAAFGAFLGVEPILFGLCATGVDSLFIGLKKMLRRIVSDARKKGGVS